MCGRFSLGVSAAALADLFELSEAPPWTPRYNIAPTQAVTTLLKPSPEASRQFRLLHWGLIPSWAEDPRIGNRLINARAETVATKPAFRDRRLALLTLVESFNRVRDGWVLTGWPLLVNVRRVLTNERPGFFDIRQAGAIQMLGIPPQSAGAEAGESA
jgi:hypothetical protein